jgi:hypothetical protein
MSSSQLVHVWTRFCLTLIQPGSVNHQKTLTKDSAVFDRHQCCGFRGPFRRENEHTATDKSDTNDTQCRVIATKSKYTDHPSRIKMN